MPHGKNIMSEQQLEDHWGQISYILTILGYDMNLLNG